MRPADRPAGRWVAAAAPAVKLPLINAGEAPTMRCAVRNAAPTSSTPCRAIACVPTRLRSCCSCASGAACCCCTARGPKTRRGWPRCRRRLKRFGLKAVATKPFKLSADPRERDLANTVLLTGGGLDYDVVWVVDSDGEFARSVPYRTALPRPVIGDAGLWADAWRPHFERFGAPQLARRFAREAKRPMTGPTGRHGSRPRRCCSPRSKRRSSAGAAQIAKSFAHEDFVLDGFKGVRVGFRPWDRQLRQPMLLTDGEGVVAHRAGRRRAASEERARHAGRRCAGVAMQSEVASADRADRTPQRRRPCAAGAVGDRAARAAEVLAPVRPAGLGAGAAAAVAGGVCGGLPQRVRHRHRRAVRHLHPVRRLHRAGPGRHGAAVQRHAVEPGDGVRPRDGADAPAAHRAAAAAVDPGRQAVRHRGAVAGAGGGVRHRRRADRHHAAAVRPADTARAAGRGVGGADARRARACC